MEFATYNRNPFTVEALMITEENLDEVAALIGIVRTKGNDRYIAINRRLVPHVTRAYVGWWVTKVDNNLRCYSPKAFAEQFSPAEDPAHPGYEQWHEGAWPSPSNE
jgi:hypothetical protein